MKRKPISRKQSVLFEERTVVNPMTNDVLDELIAVQEYKARNKKSKVGGRRW